MSRSQSSSYNSINTSNFSTGEQPWENDDDIYSISAEEESSDEEDELSTEEESSMETDEPEENSRPTTPYTDSKNSMIPPSASLNSDRKFWTSQSSLPESRSAPPSSRSLSPVTRVVGHPFDQAPSHNK